MNKNPAAKKALPKKVAPASKADVKPEPTLEPKPDVPKQKLVRDSFTMPKADFALIESLKQRAIGFKRSTRKSELLRAGLHALMALPDARLQSGLESLTPLKAGRPRKNARR